MLELSEINLAKYRRFSEYALDTRCSMAITSETGDRILTDGDFDEASTFDIHNEDTKTGTPPTVKVIRGVGDESYALRTIELGGRQEECLLVLKMGKINRRRKILPALMRDIAMAIAEDYAAQEAVSGLSDELTVRYEELNLLYRFDDSAERNVESTTKQAIMRVLNICRDYMPLDMAGVLVPGEGLQLHSIDSDFRPRAADKLLRRLRNSRFFEIKARPQTIVVNHDSQENLSDTFRSIPYKSVIAPLIGVSDQVVGMFVLANRIHRSDFTNSDRKLADIVAAEISKILQANRDRLTGLYNRKAFEVRLGAMIQDAHQTASVHVLVYMDLDRFKLINDTVGHAAGDELLAQGSAIFMQNARPNWFVARLGDDQFGLLVENTSMIAGRRIAETVRRRVMEHRFVWDEQTLHTTGSLSVVPISRATKSSAEVLAAADVACQLAKDCGRDAVRCYDPSDRNLSLYHDQLKQVSTISEALAENRFVLYGQAIAPLQSNGGTNHFEVLVRLRDRNGELVAPGVFIPAAEKYGLITAIDRWVVENSIRVMRELDAIDCAPTITCSINLSGASISDKPFLEFITGSIKDANIQPNRITFEVTETAAISNLTAALQFMETIKELGCFFALDDFGVGTNSFGHLRTLPVDYVKIDGSFVQSIVGSEIDLAVVRSINEIGHLMGLKTVAEFVENRAILDILSTTGIDYAQGFEIDEPSLLIEKYQ